MFCTIDEFINLRLNLVSEVRLVLPYGAFIDQKEHLQKISSTSSGLSPVERSARVGSPALSASSGDQKYRCAGAAGLRVPTHCQRLTQTARAIKRTSSQQSSIARMHSRRFGGHTAYSSLPSPLGLGSVDKRIKNRARLTTALSVSEFQMPYIICKNLASCLSLQCPLDPPKRQPCRRLNFWLMERGVLSGALTRSSTVALLALSKSPAAESAASCGVDSLRGTRARRRAACGVIFLYLPYPLSFGEVATMWP